MASCKARQYSDQMMCECGLQWDMNDPEPPECRAVAQTPSTRQLITRHDGTDRRHELARQTLDLDWWDVESQARQVIEHMVKVENAQRPVVGMVLNALDRDAADGRKVRAVMAAELRSVVPWK